MKKNRLAKGRFLSVLLAASLMITLPQSFFTLKKVEAANGTLSNPRIVPNGKVTWDCVWFGNYPQAEVIPSDLNYTAVRAEKLRDGDVIVSDEAYHALQDAAGWDENNDIVLDGTKYRRMKKEDALHASSNGDCEYYDWQDEETYHYFKYKPIKWRVLRTDGSRALILSDVILDNKGYNKYPGAVVWENCTMRSWLNGYGAEDNKLAVDYRGENFINSAFSAAEQAAIFSSEVKNADNIEYGTDGGNDTVDKIFLLSEAEVRNGGLAEEGKRSVSGISSSSIYAKAMGILTDYDAASYWWLRSPGGKLDSTYYPDDSRAMYVSPYGNVITGGQMVGITNLSGVRPALMLELSSSSLYTYAGTVSFGETVQGDKEPGNTGNSNGSGGAGSSSGGSNGGENGNGQTVKQFTDTASKAVYDVTAANAAGGTVTYRTSKNKKAAALTIPGQVKVSGKTYRVTKIAANAFKNCSKLKKVTIGSNITEIGKNAFSGCRKLKTITVKSKVLKKVGGKAFKGIHKKAKIKVPKAKLKAYKKLFKGKGQAKSVKITK